MSTNENVDIVREVFRAIETRNAPRLAELLDPEVEFHWAPALPYDGNVHERACDGPTWAGTWIPLQPTDAEQRMDVRIVAASDDEVVALWHQRGVTPGGDRLDGEVLGLIASGTASSRARRCSISTARRWPRFSRRRRVDAAREPGLPDETIAIGKAVHPYPAINATYAPTGY